MDLNISNHFKHHKKYGNDFLEFGNIMLVDLSIVEIKTFENPERVVVTTNEK